MLRDYQQRSIDQLYSWFKENDTGNPCLVLPTGSGKSHIVAALCKDALQNWPETVVLMLTHVKELIEQNAEKMRQHWPGAPLGIYSAGIGRRDLDEPITFAGIQSIRNRSAQIGHIDLVIVDECHLISHKDEGGYRKLISELEAINPSIRVVGLTATPYRLGHGYITDGNALFDDLIEPVTIEELIHKGYLSTVRSKVTDIKLSTDGVKKRGGEYIAKDLEAAVNTPMQNAQVVDQVIKLAGDRKAWLFFCTGIQHAIEIRDLLLSHGISAACITGKTPKGERARLLDEYKSGKIKALTNANVLTTGFDYPDIDLIALVRPTLSPTLYVQMVGRGMRLKSNTDHCLVLDFAGLVHMHGPITHVRPPKKTGGDGEGEAPVKDCPECGEITHLSVMVCPACGHIFEREEKDYKLHDVDIMGYDLAEMDVTDWDWSVKASQKTGIQMLVVTYYGELSDTPVREYLTVMHPGYAGERARRTLFALANGDLSLQQAIKEAASIEDAAALMSKAPAPKSIAFDCRGKFYDVKRRLFNET